MDAAKASEAEALQADSAAEETSGRTQRLRLGRISIARYLTDEAFDMIVTSTDIDEIIQSFSQILANAINITLHPGIYS